MKKPIIFLNILLLAVFGCQKPGPVTVDTGTSDDVLDVSTVVPADSAATFGQIDSLGILPADAATFSGFLLVNSVTYDNGPADTNVVKQYAAVYFADRSHPVVDGRGRVLGYYGMNITPTLTGSKIMVNSLPMVRIPYRLRLPGVTGDSICGYLYVRNLAGTHHPNTAFLWNVPAGDQGSVAGFTVQIVTPEDVHVLAPEGGSVLSRNSPITLRWAGKGDLNIVVSVIDPVTQATTAVMKLHPKSGTGKAVLDARVLALLPPGRHFVFSFIAANRQEITVGQYQGKVLVQAAAVYNIYVELK
jgi:hypothetical protein